MIPRSTPPEQQHACRVENSAVRTALVTYGPQGFVHTPPPRARLPPQV